MVTMTNRFGVMGASNEETESHKLGSEQQQEVQEVQVIAAEDDREKTESTTLAQMEKDLKEALKLKMESRNEDTVSNKTTQGEPPTSYRVIPQQELAVTHCPPLRASTSSVIM